ncbi:hypothetical protein CesoFtcFv8_009108 [Champsocephalus esox]|uniref:Uncharacterized protein n=1 Tax=Champsocephalus esox TaxID=159716 RepID=A0AAN8H4S7_9TELE|nr:hypothetical protein CesoFtcFv8_009108 [Champsocephalus esox]
MSSACSAAAFMDSTMARNWGPNSPSGLTGASSKTFLAGSVTAACCSQRWRWICVIQAAILSWETAAATHSVSAVLAALPISSASSVGQQHDVVRCCRRLKRTLVRPVSLAGDILVLGGGQHRAPSGDQVGLPNTEERR